MFKWSFNFIRRYECVLKYHGGLTYEDEAAWATKSHLKWGFVFAIISSLLGFIHPLFLLSYIASFLCHSLLMEIWFQYNKEKNKYLWNVMAQIIERGIWHLFLMPLPIAVLFLTLVFKCTLFYRVFGLSIL